MTCLHERNQIGRDVVYQQIPLVYYIYRCINIFFNQALNKTQDTSRFTEDTHTHTHTYTYMYLLYRYENKYIHISNDSVSKYKYMYINVYVYIIYVLFLYPVL